MDDRTPEDDATPSRDPVGPEVVRVLAPSLAAIVVGAVTLLLVGLPSQNVSDTDGSADLTGLTLGAIALGVIILGAVGLLTAAAIWIRSLRG